MIVLQEIDHADSDQVLSDDQSPYIRRHKTIAAAGPDPTAAIIPPPSHLDLSLTAPPLSAHDSVDSSETDSAVSMSELALSVSDFVDLQKRTAPDDVVLNLQASSVEVVHTNGVASAQVCLLNCMCALVFVCRACHRFRLLMFF
jgi:hypothetical protein